MNNEINSIKPIDIRIVKIQYPMLFPLWIAIFIDILGFTLLIPFLPFFIKELFIYLCSERLTTRKKKCDIKKEIPVLLFQFIRKPSYKNI